MEHLARSFAHLLFHQHPSQASQGRPEPTNAKPSREDVLNYLGQLAHDYHLPQNVVYAVADTESSVGPTIPPHPNYETRHGRVVHDKQGKPVVKSWDYGLMQVNGKKIGEKAKDPQ